MREPRCSKRPPVKNKRLRFRICVEVHNQRFSRLGTKTIGLDLPILRHGWPDCPSGQKTWKKTLVLNLATELNLKSCLIVLL